MEEEKLNQIVCNVKFISIFDNRGKIIYGKYYTINDADQQREFEKRICILAKDTNPQHEELDIINIDNFNILFKLQGDIAIFIGFDENDNECLGAEFYKIFESNLGTIINYKYTRSGLLKNYGKIVTLIDEMVNEGIVINTDIDSLERLIELRENASSSNTFIDFGNNAIGGSGSLIGSLFSGAKSLFG
jgi:hypothetical protein